MPDIDYSLATRRLYWFTLAAGFLGLPVAALGGGAPSAIGFAIGVVGSLFNLWLWQRVAGKLGQPSSRQSVKSAQSIAPAAVSSGPSPASLTVRVLALFACAYAIVRALNVNGLAVLCGLLASAFAALFEILYELFLLPRSGSSQ
jgi:hypothetical protein